MTRSARSLSYALLGTALGLMALLIARIPRHADPPPHSAPSSPMQMAGVRTEIYEANALRLTASARSVQFEPARVFGLLRIGFLRAVVASDVQIELVRNEPDRSAPLDLAAYVKDVGAALGRRVGSLGGAELRELTITSRSATGDALTLLHARRCRAGVGERTMACSGGVLREGDALVPFAEAVHDGRQWHVTKPVPH